MLGWTLNIKKLSLGGGVPKVIDNTIVPHQLIADDFWGDYLHHLSDIAKAELEDCGNTLCEQKSSKLDSEYIDFMKGTPLADIEFEIPPEILNEGVIFYIKNVKTNTRMAFSNRGGKAELRGQSLRDKLTVIKQLNDQLSLYDALSGMIRDPEYSDLHKYLLGMPVLEHEDQTTKRIITECSKALIALLDSGEEVTVEIAKNIYKEQHAAYFSRCPALIQKLSGELQSTARMLTRFLIEAQTNNDAQAVAQLNSAIRATYQLMPTYYSDGRIEFPNDYAQRVVNYNLQAQQLANNPAYAEYTHLRSVGVVMLSVGIIALATFVLFLAFPPAALFMSQLIFHGAIGAATITGSAAGAGITSTCVGFFSTAKAKVTADQTMSSLSAMGVETENRLNPVPISA